MTRPEFNPNGYFEKKRDVQGSVVYTQDGHQFSAGRTYIGKAGAVVDVKSKVKKKEMRASIADKLKGFTNDETPDTVIDALKENDAAKQAEDRA